MLPGLLESLFRPPMSGPGLQLYINAYNTIWVFVFVCVAYAVVRCQKLNREALHTYACDIFIAVIAILASTVGKMHGSSAVTPLCFFACFRGALQDRILLHE